MRLSLFLEKFKNSKDKDFPKSDYAIVFSKDSSYTIKGKTHGLLSHAIKHLIEFKKSDVQRIINKTRALISLQDEIYIIDRKSRIFTTNKINDSYILNTFDYINDKVHFNEPLSDIESKIYKNAQELEILYKQLIDDMKNRAIDVNEYDYTSIWKLYKTQKIISFNVITSGAKMTYYINFANNALLITYNDNEKSLYKMYNIKDLISKRNSRFNTKIINKNLQDVINNIG